MKPTRISQQAPPSHPQGTGATLPQCLRIGMAILVATSGSVLAQTGHEPLAGQPPEGAKSSVEDFDYQLKYQRAFEAVLWNMPAMAIYSFRRGAVDELDCKDNDIIAYSATATPQLEALTANSTTPYISAFTDLREGPVVLEVPPAGADGSLYGQVVDAWQYTIADVGPAGLDQGKGGKYLFTPPGYDKEIPEGYFHIASPNYRIALAFRSVPAKGKSANDAYTYTPSACGCITSRRRKTRRSNDSSTPPKNVTRPCLSTTSATSKTCTPSSVSSRSKRTFWMPGMQLTRKY